MTLQLLKWDARSEFLELILFVLLWGLFVIWPEEAAHVLCGTFYDGVMFKLCDLPQELPREQAAELLKWAVDGAASHDIHAQTASWTGITLSIDLDIAVTARV